MATHDLTEPDLTGTGSGRASGLLRSLRGSRRTWGILVLGLVGLAIGVGVVVVTVFVTAWLASTERSAYGFDSVDSVLIVNDGGAVRIRSLDSVDAALAADLDRTGADGRTGDTGVAGAGVIVQTSDSWLLRTPTFESLQRDGQLVVRATCNTRLPCRTTLDVYVPAGIELTVVAASDIVQVDAFDGALLLFAGDEGVVLGSITGSVSVVRRSSTNFSKALLGKL